jgi:hypothetical protein
MNRLSIWAETLGTTQLTVHSKKAHLTAAVNVELHVMCRCPPVVRQSVQVPLKGSGLFQI